MFVENIYKLGCLEGSGAPVLYRTHGPKLLIFLKDKIIMFAGKT
jgi:hypothetical protein